MEKNFAWYILILYYAVDWFEIKMAANPNDKVVLNKYYAGVKAQMKNRLKNTKKM